jgi:hypothetical protein
MSDWLIFLIGFMIGGLMGVLSMSLMSAHRFNEMQTRVSELVAMRNALKTELIKPKSKPKPRKKR